jgi:hypothetical protein
MQQASPVVIKGLNSVDGRIGKEIRLAVEPLIVKTDRIGFAEAGQRHKRLGAWRHHWYPPFIPRRKVLIQKQYSNTSMW